MSGHGYLVDLAVLVDDPTDAGNLLAAFAAEQPVSSFLLAPGRAEVSPGESVGQLEVTILSAHVDRLTNARAAAEAYGHILRCDGETFDPDLLWRPEPAGVCTPDWDDPAEQADGGDA